MQDYSPCLRESKWTRIIEHQLFTPVLHPSAVSGGFLDRELALENVGGNFGRFGEGKKNQKKF